MATTAEWNARVGAMLDAIQDVAPQGHPPRGGPGSAPHRGLFRQYVEALRQAKILADAWWQALIDTEEEDRTGDREQAVENVRMRRPVGPVAHGAVIAAIREFWLRCAALNREVAEQERVAPEEFVLGWLAALNHLDLAEFLAGLPFWPIGMDTKGNWV